MQLLHPQSESLDLRHFLVFSLISFRQLLSLWYTFAFLSLSLELTCPLFTAHDDLDLESWLNETSRETETSKQIPIE